MRQAPKEAGWAGSAAPQAAVSGAEDRKATSVRTAGAG